MVRTPHSHSAALNAELALLFFDESNGFGSAALKAEIDTIKRCCNSIKTSEQREMESILNALKGYKFAKTNPESVIKARLMKYMNEVLASKLKEAAEQYPQIKGIVGDTTGEDLQDALIPHLLPFAKDLTNTRRAR